MTATQLHDVLADTQAVLLDLAEARVSAEASAERVRVLRARLDALERRGLLPGGIVVDASGVGQVRQD